MSTPPPPHRPFSPAIHASLSPASSFFRTTRGAWGLCFAQKLPRAHLVYTPLRPVSAMPGEEPGSTGYGSFGPDTQSTFRLVPPHASLSVHELFLPMPGGGTGDAAFRRPGPRPRVYIALLRSPPPRPMARHLVSTNYFCPVPGGRDGGDCCRRSGPDLHIFQLLSPPPASFSLRNVSANRQAEGSVTLAVDGSSLIYHVMRNPGGHELHLDLG